MSLRISNVLKTYNVSNVTNQSQAHGRMTRAEEKRDMVALSGQARDYQKASQALKWVSDIRFERVAEIQEQIESGYYDVSATDIAEKMLSEISGQV